MRRKNNASEMIGGQDSFLDIVANLVGILIILVVVVGAQATSFKKEQLPDQEMEKQIAEKKVVLDHLVQQARRMTIDNHQLERDIVDEKLLTKQLADERHAKMMQMELVRREIEKRTADWNEFEKDVFNRQATISSLKQQLTQVQAKANAWQNEEVVRVEAIEHFPTPIVKTVFTDEIHFRMSEGRISFVPMQPLIDEMKSQWKVVAENLSNSNQAVETVGPIAGYRLQYELRKKRATRNTRNGSVQGESIEFDHFVILPTSERNGETVGQAFQMGSEFLRRLSDRQPDRTTISVWVYPDSYEDFMKLKKELHRQGFQIASWPLEHGRPISGGPRGFKTSAQ